ncbi:hypothetical protein [Pseudomonas sp. URIL14HWK12:I6]|uniref:hypothetical protein n=1 Tax=Pseudomonas sp. URIL14HWK12:I6 TaxID=1283293 RepID=UPI0012DEA052|nr:hypothetical protein [Pseudomonas sp. URIL14HWK12:I6]
MFGAQDKFVEKIGSVMKKGDMAGWKACFRAVEDVSKPKNNFHGINIFRSAGHSGGSEPARESGVPVSGGVI